MRLLISGGADNDNNIGVRINADSGGEGGQIRPPSSRRHACCVADLLARDASYRDIHTPFYQAVAGSWPLVVQLLVRVLRCHSVLWEAMRARDASFEMACAYASMPPTRQKRRGRGFGSKCGGGRGRGRLGDLTAPAGAHRCRRRRCSQLCGVDGGVVDTCRGGGGVSSIRAAN